MLVLVLLPPGPLRVVQMLGRVPSVLVWRVLDKDIPTHP